MNYASAVGVDYKDGKYYGYIQFIDFQSIAKKEGGGQKQPARIWVGEGVGNSFEESFFDLYRTAQERIYWGHVTAVLITESAFKQGFESISDSLSRYYEFRLTPWVFGTRESIKDIFSSAGFFGESPLSTILHAPEGTYTQTSLIKSIKLHRLIAQVYEPGYTSCIPVLALNKKQWKEKNKPEPKLMIDGAIFLKNKSFRSYISLKKLNGLRWIQHGSERAGIPVPNKAAPVAQIVVDNPKTKLKFVNRGDGPQYKIKMKATAYIVNRSSNNLSELQQLTDKTKEAIEKEIRETFQAGREKQTDVLNLEHNLYRNHYREWKALSPAETKLLAEDVIREIKIDLNITHSSSKKNARIREVIH